MSIHIRSLIIGYHGHVNPKHIVCAYLHGSVDNPCIIVMMQYFES